MFIEKKPSKLLCITYFLCFNIFNLPFCGNSYPSTSFLQYGLPVWSLPASVHLAHGSILVTGLIFFANISRVDFQKVTNRIAVQLSSSSTNTNNKICSNHIIASVLNLGFQVILMQHTIPKVYFLTMLISEGFSTSNLCSKIATSSCWWFRNPANRLSNMKAGFQAGDSPDFFQGTVGSRRLVTETENTEITRTKHVKTYLLQHPAKTRQLWIGILVVVSWILPCTAL